jgi:hypothetical protein
MSNDENSQEAGSSPAKRTIFPTRERFSLNRVAQDYVKIVKRPNGRTPGKQSTDTSRTSRP